jgi:hypothetical protein
LYRRKISFAPPHPWPQLKYALEKQSAWYKIISRQTVKKKRYRFFLEYHTQIDRVPVTKTKRKDNKIRSSLYSQIFSGVESASEVARFDKKKKVYTLVPCPNVVKTYNQHISGVDLLHSIIARYRIAMLSKK